jgi:hypothetical protein
MLPVLAAVGGLEDGAAGATGSGCCAVNRVDAAEAGCRGGVLHLPDFLRLMLRLCLYWRRRRVWRVSCGKGCGDEEQTETTELHGWDYRAGTSKEGYMRSHPCDKSKDVARVGHPLLLEVIRGIQLLA